MQCTDAAAAYLKACSQKQACAYWYITLKRLGCSGYQYEARWERHPVGIIVPMEGWSVCMDPAWAHLLGDVQVDVSSDALGQKKIVFSSKKTHTACGCGESFMVDGV